MKINENKHESCHMKSKCQQYDVCPMVLVQDILSGKRKILILWYLSYQKLRFSEINSKMPEVTQKVLTQQLRGLESDGLIYRTVYPEVPPKVEYAITELGMRLIPILEAMHNFGSDLLEARQDDL